MLTTSLQKVLQPTQNHKKHMPISISKHGETFDIFGRLMKMIQFSQFKCMTRAVIWYFNDVINIVEVLVGKLCQIMSKETTKSSIRV